MANKTMPARIEADEKRRRWVDMRLKGMTYGAIATADGLAYNQWKTVQKGVKTYLDRYHTRKADELRKVQGARLETLINVHWPRALEGDVEAAVLVLKLIERECRLWGIDRAQDSPLIQQVNQVLVTYANPGGEDWRAKEVTDGEEAKAGEEGDTGE